MDNLTHSLLGAALAEIALPAEPKAPRRLFYAIGIVTANLPDLDIAYAWITPPPLGYLLHHRGHTHTLGGIVVQALLVGLICHGFQRIRRLDASVRRRLKLLILAGLFSHVLLDAANSYGVHPFYPITSRWYYGDAVFIFEPWLWMFLAVPVALSASRRATRLTLLGVALLLPMTLAVLGMVPWAALAVLLVAGTLFGWQMVRLAPRMRNVTGVLASAAFSVLIVLLSQVAHRAVTDTLAGRTSGDIVDIVLSADPANPVCWSLIAIERREDVREYVMRPGVLSLLPGLVAPGSCASHRFRGSLNSERIAANVVSHGEIRQSLDSLRTLHDRDCRVRAWLQFGRAPVVAGGRIFDQRYERGRDNFSAMTLTDPTEAGACPRYLTSWGLPRADLLAR